MASEERKALQVGGGMTHGRLETGKENVGFRTQNVQAENSLKREAWPN